MSAYKEESVNDSKIFILFTDQRVSTTDICTGSNARTRSTSKPTTLPGLEERKRRNLGKLTTPCCRVYDYRLCNPRYRKRHPTNRHDRVSFTFPFPYGRFHFSALSLPESNQGEQCKTARAKVTHVCRLNRISSSVK